METAELVLPNLIVVQVLHLASIPVQPDSLGEGGIEGLSPHRVLNRPSYHLLHIMRLGQCLLSTLILQISTYA